MVATPYRFDGDKSRAERFFEEGLAQAFQHIREAQNPAYPMTVYYAFRQAEADIDEEENGLSGVAVSTGWETMLEQCSGPALQLTVLGRSALS